MASSRGALNPALAMLRQLSQEISGSRFVAVGWLPWPTMQVRGLGESQRYNKQILVGKHHLLVDVGRGATKNKQFSGFGFQPLNHNKQK